jgi:hypothetical protein
LFSADLGEFKFVQVRSHATDPTSRSMKKHARNRWGGARAGAGRPPGGARSSEPHKARPELARTRAVHVTARFEDGIRRRDVAPAIEHALALSRARVDFRIVRLAMRPAALDLVIDAIDRRALARGMQGFQVSAARGINRAARRRGRVFADRYRVRATSRR